MKAEMKIPLWLTMTCISILLFALIGISIKFLGDAGKAEQDAEFNNRTTVNMQNEQLNRY